MIKTFEQFVSTVYGETVNEGFQSKKLSELVKKHGKPRDRDCCSVHSYVNDQYLKKRALYDIKDSDIIDVVSRERVTANTHLSRDYKDSNNKYMPTRIIVLEHTGTIEKQIWLAVQGKQKMHDLYMNIYKAY